MSSYKKPLGGCHGKLPQNSAQNHNDKISTVQGHKNMVLLSFIGSVNVSTEIFITVLESVVNKKKYRCRCSKHHFLPW